MHGSLENQSATSKNRFDNRTRINGRTKECETNMYKINSQEIENTQIGETSRLVERVK